MPLIQNQLNRKKYTPPELKPIYT